MAETLVGSEGPEPMRGPNFDLLDEGAALRLLIWTGQASHENWVPPIQASRDYLILMCCRLDRLDVPDTKRLIDSLYPRDERLAFALQMEFLEGYKSTFFDVVDGAPRPNSALAFGMAIANGVISPSRLKSGKVRDLPDLPDILDVPATEMAFVNYLGPALPGALWNVNGTLFGGNEQEQLFRGSYLVVSRYVDLDDKTAGFG